MKTDVQDHAVDFNELALLVAREIDYALKLSELAALSDKLHIASLTIKLGGPLPLENSPDASIERRAGIGGASTKPFLLLPRYPPAKDGWLFEIKYAPGPTPPSFHGPEGIWFTLPFQELPTAGDFLKGLPVRAIKGVSRTWAEKLRKFKISTIGDLISLPPSEAGELIPRVRSKYILELRFKAALLNAVVPEIPPSAADRHSLHGLLGKSPNDLRKLIGAEKFSATASEQLFNIISLLYTTINTSELKSYSLKDLRSPKKWDHS